MYSITSTLVLIKKLYSLCCCCQAENACAKNSWEESSFNWVWEMNFIDTFSHADVCICKVNGYG